MIELLGMLLIVQGAGGFINRVAGADSDSWFVQLHLLPDVLHIPASVLMALAGAGLVVLSTRRRGRAAG